MSGTTDMAELEAKHKEKIVAQRGQVLNWLRVIFAANYAVVGLTMDAKMLIYLKDMDQVSYARWYANTLSLGQVIGMFLSPLGAMVANSKGRKASMRLFTGGSFILRALDFLIPKWQTMACTTSFSAITFGIFPVSLTMIADSFPGDTAGAGGTIAQFTSFQQLCSVIFPVIGARLAKQSVRIPLLLSLGCAALQLFANSQLPETAMKEKMVPVDLSKINPLAPYKLFTHGGKLACFALAQFCAMFSDPTMLGRPVTLVQMDSLGWDVVGCGQYVSLSNLFQVPGLQLAGKAVKGGSIHPQVGLTLGAGVIAIQHFLEATWVTQPWQAYTLLLMMPLRGLSKASLESMCLEAGQLAGLGNAELRAYLEGLKSFAWVICSPFWAWLYAQMLKRNRPRGFFLGVCAVAVVRLLLGLLGSVLPPPKLKDSEKK